ncbi:MAG: OmpA family protein [Granulosicoccus sp.]
MKIFRLSVVAALATVIFTAGCATNDPHRRAKTGAAIGAIAGGIIGNQSSSKNGKFIGAAVGALTGAAVGNYMDKQQRQLEKRLAAERAAKEITLTRIDAETLRVDISSEASFDINSAGLRQDFRGSLNTIADIIGEYNTTVVHIIGHTDSTGSTSYNQQLSEKRAASVSRYLSRNGVTRARMRMSGQGELKPVANNSTSGGRSQNRRVEIYLKAIVKGRENEAARSPI